LFQMRCKDSFFFEPPNAAFKKERKKADAIVGSSAFQSFTI